MADVFPSSLIHRNNPNLRLGIKSSLNSFKQLIASLYVIYKVVEQPEDIVYSEEFDDGGNVAIRLEQQLGERIKTTFPQLADGVERISQSPLFKSQCEALQVGLELFLHMAKISFVDDGRQERTGANRYNKSLSFSDKMLVLDMYLSTVKDNVQTDELIDSWLSNKECGSELEKGLKVILSTFVVDCCYKIKKVDGSEIVFNLENICSALADGNDVLFKDGEVVGPMRVLNSYISENMLPYVSKSQRVYKTDDVEKIANRVSLMSTTLDLTTRQLSFDDKGAGKQKFPFMAISSGASSQFLPFLTALRTKPFLLLAGISGTGKSRIVRKLAQATVTENLQRKYDKEYKGTDFAEDRWSLHSPANFQLIQVKPNWHNSMDVVGYFSNIPNPHYVFTPFVEFIVRAWQNPDVPFFLCLDEMNLAPVEEYFAEFLSAIESRGFEKGKDGELVYMTDPIIKPFDEFGTYDADNNGESYKISAQMIGALNASLSEEMDNKIEKHFRFRGLTLPANLMVIGTVNMDETTFSFSRKVLDRAMSIEMNEVNYDSFLQNTTDDGLKEIVADFDAGKFGEGVTLNHLLINRPIEAKEIKDELGENAQTVIDYLKKVNCLLEGTPFKLGYRAANEALIYLLASFDFGQTDCMVALDRFTMMKILSRVEGDEAKLRLSTGSNVDEERLTKAGVNANEAKKYGDLNLLTALRTLFVSTFGDKEEWLSVKKIDSMIAQLSRDHFVSYWN